MADAFTILGSNNNPVSGMDGNGNIWGSGYISGATLQVGGAVTFGAALTLSGTLALNGGTNTATAAAANIISSPGFSSGTASQLSDLTRDYMVYLQIGTGGGTVTLSMGPTSAGTTVPILTSAAGVNGELLTVRLPAGWYLKITLATSTLADQVAVAC